jgi:DNA polymerase-3 subunit gamma/tau
VQYKTSKNQRLHVELALILLCNIDTEKKNSSINQSTAAIQGSGSSGQAVSAAVKPSVIPVSQNNTSKAVKPPQPNIPSFSIKDGLKSSTLKTPVESAKESKTEVKESAVSYAGLATSSFSLEQLTEAWEKMAAVYKDTDPRMFSTLTTQPPALKENYLVEYTLNNPLQEEEVQKIRASIVNFLQKELSNGSIELVTVVSESPQGNKKFYSDKEKFDHMAQKNPSLLKFKQQFGLDFG